MSVASGQVSWADRVPYDVWYAILEECDCLPTSRDFWNPDLPDRYYTHIMPLTISHVCQALRSFSLSIPSLWTRISLLIRNHPCENYGPETQWKLMELFLERSRDQPLYVTLSIGNFNMAKQKKQHQFLVKLFATSTRWKRAELELDVEWINDDAWSVWFGEIVRDAMPLTLLESLEVRATLQTDEAHDDFNKIKLPINLWKTSPSMTHLAISIQQLDLEEYETAISDFMGWPIRSEIPFVQITHLLVEGGLSTCMCWNNVGQIFSAAPNLIVCVLQGICAYPRSNLSTPVVLPSLMHLYLEASGMRGTYQSLTPGLNRVLTAPVLRTLTLAYGDGRESTHNRDRWEQQPYTEFIARSSCSLEELRFIKLKVPIDDLLLCMELSPTLKVLHTSLATDTDSISQFIVRMEEERRGNVTSSNVLSFTLCPLLRELGLYAGYYSTELGRLLDSPRFSSLQRNKSGTNTDIQKVMIWYPEPYYVKNYPETIAKALNGLPHAIRSSDSRRCTMSYYYFARHTIRRFEFWDRFKFEKGISV